MTLNLLRLALRYEKELAILCDSGAALTTDMRS